EWATPELDAHKENLEPCLAELLHTLDQYVWVVHRRFEAQKKARDGREIRHRPQGIRRVRRVRRRHEDGFRRRRLRSALAPRLFPRGLAGEMGLRRGDP